MGSVFRRGHHEHPQKWFEYGWWVPMALQVIVVGLILIAILSFDTLREIS